MTAAAARVITHRSTICFIHGRVPAASKVIIPGTATHIPMQREGLMGICKRVCQPSMRAHDNMYKKIVPLPSEVRVEVRKAERSSPAAKKAHKSTTAPITEK